MTAAEPAFDGYVESTLDALLIFEACRRGICPRITRRLQEKERKLIKSGAVFVFDEREAGIKRWTDGLVWSPSRILNNFLVYRELDKRQTAAAAQAAASSNSTAAPSTSAETVGGGASPRSQYSSPVQPSSPVPDVPLPLTLPPGNLSPPSPSSAFNRPRSMSDTNDAALNRARERALVGSLTSSYRFKGQGLVKKTISISGMHMISYYRMEDVLQARLRTPSSIPEYASLRISPNFLLHQNFRNPPHTEIGPDGQPVYRGEADGTAPSPTLGPTDLSGSSGTPQRFVLDGSDSRPLTAGSVPTQRNGSWAPAQTGAFGARTHRTLSSGGIGQSYHLGPGQNSRSYRYEPYPSLNRLTMTASGANEPAEIPNALNIGLVPHRTGQMVDSPVEWPAQSSESYASYGSPASRVPGSFGASGSSDYKSGVSQYNFQPSGRPHTQPAPSFSPRDNAHSYNNPSHQSSGSSNASQHAGAPFYSTVSTGDSSSYQISRSHPASLPGSSTPQQGAFPQQVGLPGLNSFRSSAPASGFTHVQPSGSGQPGQSNPSYSNQQYHHQGGGQFPVAPPGAGTIGHGQDLSLPNPQPTGMVMAVGSSDGAHGHPPDFGGGGAGAGGGGAAPTQPTWTAQHYPEAHWGYRTKQEQE